MPAPTLADAMAAIGKKSVTFAQVSADWLAHKKNLAEHGRLAQSTVRSYKKIIATLDETFGAKDIERVHKKDIETFLAKRHKGRAASTVNLELTILRAILSFAYEEGHIAAVPRVKPVDDPDVEEPELPEISRVLKFIERMPDRVRLPLKFSMLTGCSWHEVERLEKRDLDFARKRIRIGYRDDFGIKTAYRKRELPMTPQVAAVLREALPRGAPPETRVFPGAHGGRQVVWRNRRPKDSDLSPAVMRKVFASIAANEVPEHVLQRLLGHAPGSRITRKHYLRSRRSEMERAMSTVAEVVG